MNKHSGATQEVFDQLTELANLSPRFHGSEGLRRAEKLIASWLDSAGLSVSRQEVILPGWSPGEESALRIVAPLERDLPAWPMIWSGGAAGTVEGSLVRVGVQGLWGDSMVWTKYAVVNGAETVAYVHARDRGPAAPQPLPVGSDLSVPHLAIGHIDGMAIQEWLSDGFEVEVQLRCDAGPAAPAIGNNLIVDISAAPGAEGKGRAVVTAHYDSLYNTPGAYDNGSGAVALARIAAELKKAPPSRPLTLLFATAEEWHLGGSRQYVESLSEEDLSALDFMFNIDGIGRGDFLEAFAGPESFEREFLEAIANYADKERPDLRVQSRFPPTCGVDLAPFYARGVPAAYFTINDLHLLHQPVDLPTWGSAENIVWSVPFVQQLLSTLPRGDRFPAGRLAIPF